MSASGIQDILQDIHSTAEVSKYSRLTTLGILDSIYIIFHKLDMLYRGRFDGAGQGVYSMTLTNSR